MEYRNLKNKKSLLALLLVFAFVLSACNLSGDDEETTGSSTESTEKVENVNVDSEDLQKRIYAYIDTVVNGSFREVSTFPNFTSLGEIPAVDFADSDLLRNYLKELDVNSVSREDYEAYLQDNFNPKITLPKNANYQRNYNKEDDVFALNVEREERSFIPSSFWQGIEFSSSGDDIYFDAYEFNYEFVNKETGIDEVDNPIARIVVDETTIGFATPIIKRDLYLIDHSPLAKTRYTLRINDNDRLNLISKTSLDRDANFKHSAQMKYNHVEAKEGRVGKLSSNRLNIYARPSSNADTLGNVEENTYMWYIDLNPELDFYLTAPASTGTAFNYNYGFGFANKKNIA